MFRALINALFGNLLSSEGLQVVRIVVYSIAGIIIFCVIFLPSIVNAFYKDDDAQQDKNEEQKTPDNDNSPTVL